MKKEIIFKNFRAVEHAIAEYRIYFTHNGEERFIGYKKGIISDSCTDSEKEEFFLGNRVGNYREVFERWEISGKK